MRFKPRFIFCMCISNSPAPFIEKAILPPLNCFCSFVKIQLGRDFSGGPAVKTPRSQCRGPRFDPWSGN